mmetsp:Transcript_158987/g.486552  ORF Transcript_158987/g.486552 Transcript_158987/m.486552 type:complete len:407 (+) Transcript_158987:48-1268(+)
MLLPGQDPLLAGSPAVEHPDGVLGHDATGGVHVQRSGQVADAGHVAAANSQVPLRNLVNHAILDPTLLGDAPDVHGLARREAGAGGAVDLRLLQHHQHQGVRLVKQRRDVLLVLPLLPALRVLGLGPCRALQQLRQARVVRPLRGVLARPARVHERAQLLGHLLELLPSSAGGVPALVQQTLLGRAHALRDLRLQAGGVGNGVAEGVLELVELLQGLEPRQLAEDAVHQRPAQGLDVVCRAARVPARGADGAEFHGAGLLGGHAAVARVPSGATKVDEDGHVAAVGLADEHVVRRHVAVHVAAVVEGAEAAQEHHAQDADRPPPLSEGPVEERLEYRGEVGPQELGGKVVPAPLRARGEERWQTREGLLAVLGCQGPLPQLLHDGHLLEVHRPLDGDALGSPRVSP